MRRVQATVIAAICLGACIVSVAQVTVSGPGSVGVGQVFGGTINIGVTQAELEAAIRASGAEQLKLLRDIAAKVNAALVERRGPAHMRPSPDSFSATIVHGFLATVVGKRVPEADWPRVFNELAVRYLELGARISQTPATSERIKALVSRADEARKAGDLNKADAVLEEAERQAISDAARMKEQARESNRQAASLLATRASLAFTRLERERAATLLQRAFEQRADDVSSESLWWLFEASAAWEVLGDTRRMFQLRDQALRVAAREAAVNPDSIDWKRNLSVSHSMVGDSQQVMGDLTAALGSYQDAMSVLQTLASADQSNNYRWWPDIAVTHERIGDVLVAQGNLSAALENYEAGMAICLGLPDTVAATPWWQRYLFVGHIKKGNLEVVRHDLGSALKSFQTSRVIAEALVAARPSDIDRLSDLSASHNKIGDVLSFQGDLDAALTSYQAGKKITQNLALADPANTKLQGDLSGSHLRIGGIMKKQSNVAGALDSFQTGLAIARKLKDADTSNTKWQKLIAGFCLQIAVPQKPDPGNLDQIEALGKCLMQ